MNRKALRWSTNRNTLTTSIPQQQKSKIEKEQQTYSSSRSRRPLLRLRGRHHRSYLHVPLRRRDSSLRSSRNWDAATVKTWSRRQRASISLQQQTQCQWALIPLPSSMHHNIRFTIALPTIKLSFQCTPIHQPSHFQDHHRLLNSFKNPHNSVYPSSQQPHPCQPRKSIITSLQTKQYPRKTS